MIRAIVFDLHDTLAHRDPSAMAVAQTAVSAYLKSRGYEISEKDLAEAARRRATGIIRTLHSQNKEVSFAYWWKGLLHELGIEYDEELGIQMSDLYSNTLAGFIHLLPGVKDMLEFLNGKFRLGLISNSLAENTRKDLKVLSITGNLDSIVISSDMGIRKPDPRIFLYALEQLNIAAGDAIFVGDNFQEDIVGAKGVGMKTVLVTGESSMQPVDTEPDFVVARSVDIMSLPILAESLAARMAGR